MSSVPEIQTHKNIPADYYDYGIKHNFFQWLWNTWKHRQVRRALLKIETPFNRILDFGCADGIAIDRITAGFKNLEIHGVDILEKTIKYGRSKRPHLHFKRIDGIHLPYSNEYFDIITALDVLEHVSHLENVLSEISRCLKSNGVLIITAPNENLLWKIVWGIWIHYRDKLWQEVHINNLDFTVLAKNLQDRGFRIDKKTRTHLGLLNFLIAKKI